MDNSPPGVATDRGTGPILLSPTRTVFLAIAMGLCGGYLDLAVLTFKKYYINELRYFWIGADFLWSVPVVHAALLAVAGAVVAVVDRIRPGGPLTLRAGARLFATLAIWSALLRLPFYGVCTLLLAGGLARPIGAIAVACGRRPRRARYAFGGILGLLVLLAAVPSGRRATRTPGSAIAATAPPGARNVLMIVWDTVRSPSLSLYGYPRDTTPRLKEWAQKGVRYGLALVPAPWTYPSHSSFFTGQWPFKLDSQWNFTLDAAYPTLAEYLGSKGYQTVGFVANTRGCSYETGLDRGFAEYEDYPTTPRFLLGRTVPGSWILKNLLARGDFYESKWIDAQSRDARGINEAFLGWLGRRRRDRPFFAFLNYYDAHSPYVPPADYVGRFGAPPRHPEDYRLLFDFTKLATARDWRRNFLMARDCYDACIASLDHQLGRLLDTLRGRGLLDNTLVIITSDHGESFGDHRVFGHGAALYLDQTAVPLVILAPDAPAGRAVAAPVSLRDLPATVVDRLGLSAGSPFPGHSLASSWSTAPGRPTPEVSPPLSEMAQAKVFQPRTPGASKREGMQMSLVAPGWHYIRDGRGIEQLYDLRRDPSELHNLADSAESDPALRAFRGELLDILKDEPGSIEVERTYLNPYRRRLESVIREGPLPRESTAAAGSR